MDEFEFMLEDRIGKIQAINKQYDLEHNAYISFSGGKDSTVLHYLIDMALPNNSIPRVFSNTGIEYKFIREFVEELAATDPRIQIVNASVNLKQMWETEGYPFKSKEHSKKLLEYKRGSRSASSIQYKTGIRILPDGSTTKSFAACPKILLEQYNEDYPIKISHMCCKRLKKDPMHNWAKENNKTIYMTGMRSAEGGQRRAMHCVLTDKLGNLYSFSPLAVVSDDWEEEFIKRYKIPICKLYYPPYNFTRTGCKGCPFTLDLQNQLDTMEKLLPNEKKQCEIMFKPVYDEYRRLGYRLRKKGKCRQMTIFDFMDNDTLCKQKEGVWK